MIPTSRKIAIFLGAVALCTCNVETGPRTDKAAAERPAETSGASLFAEAPDKRWRLPNRLAEISGLATTPDGRLFGHGDERGVLYELDIERGRITKNFAIGQPIVRADFEGLAITPRGDFFLVTSTGQLFRFREGADGEHVRYDMADTGLARVCEVEGLSALRQSLILACKANYAKGMRHTLALYSWPIRGGAATRWMSVRGDLVHGLNPSAVEIDPATGRVIVLAARERALLELDRNGRIVASRRLDLSHVQAEGVAIMPDGALVIADEAAGSQALLTRYPRR